MRIAFRQTGGFTGTVKSVELDSDQMPPEEQERVRALLDESRFFDATSPPVPAAPDREQYTIRVESEDRSRTVHVSGGALPESMKPLVRYLAGKAKYEKR